MWGEGFSVYFLKTKIFFEKLTKIQKNNLLVFVFYGTIYRLYHTHSFGSVEPTIALSESLWSRIVTQNKKKNISKKKKKKFTKIFASVVCFYVFNCVLCFVLSNHDDELSLFCCDFENFDYLLRLLVICFGFNVHKS